MRKTVCFVAVSGLLGLMAAVQVGCWSTYDDYYLPLAQPIGGSGGSTSSTTGSGGTGGSTVQCDGDPTQDPAIVSDDCGVFVSASAADGGTGTKASPFKTFADAAVAGSGKRIYACAETYNETKAVSFTGGVEIYAGFTDCTSTTGWSWQATTFATLNGAPDVPALVLDGGTSHIQNLNVMAANATVGGGSSIALIVNGGTLDMPNGALEARIAKAGDPGTHVADDSTLDGEQGANGKNTCDPGATHAGPKGNTKVCGTGDSSTAGDGGDGGGLTGGVPDPAASGTNGSPPDASQPTKGVGGIGEGQGSPVATTCESGDDGANGAAGSSGAGATGAGSVSSNGYVGNKGVDGGTGKPGQGGGGGGGAKGATSVDCGSGPTPVLGASGGAGGTGGCGGALGGGGNPGGSSIALVSLGATVTLGQVMLTAGVAGEGGKGGDGQSGGQKGPGGGPGAGKGTASGSCRGGDGGQGGPGGPGGGGQGGHSLGIAYKGVVPQGGMFAVNPANKGQGGPGGTGNTTADNGNGIDGVATNTLSFD